MDGSNGSIGKQKKISIISGRSKKPVRSSQTSGTSRKNKTDLLDEVVAKSDLVAGFESVENVIPQFPNFIAVQVQHAQMRKIDKCIRLNVVDVVVAET